MKTNSKCSLIIFSCVLVLMFVNLKSFAAENSHLIKKNNSSSCLIIKDRYWLDVKNSSNQYYSQVLVAHLPNATYGYDDGLDGIYINDCQTVMSSIVQNNELVINALPTFDIQENVVFQFRNDVANTFTISLNAVQGIFNTNQPIFIQDQVTGITKNLKTGSYTFYAPPGVYNNRFKFGYQDPALVAFTINDFSSNIKLYSSKGIIHINSGKTQIETVSIYGLNGQLIQTKNEIYSNEVIIESSLFTNQIVIVEIKNDTENKIISRKLVVQN